MLSVTPISVRQAGTYYEKDSYYSSEKPGEWAGRAADELGLRDEINGEDWQRVIRGQDPRTGEQLVQAGANGEHRSATDTTFSAPKSASVLALLLNRTDIIEAHRKAVEVAIKYMEQDAAQARVTVDGLTERVHTGNLLIAIYEHTRSRELDPQLHTHCPVLNMTEMPDGSWKAVSNERFFENKLFYGQIYRNELAANLKELGYQIEYSKDGLFEIAGIDKSILETFSRRSEQIKEAMNEIREKYPHADESQLREYATLGSRVAKQKNIDNDAVHASWVERLRSLGLSPDDLNRTIDVTIETTDRGKESMNADDAISMAGKLITEQELTFPKEQLLRIAGQFSLGSARISDLERAARDQLRSGQILQRKDGSYTTAEKVQEVSETVQMMKDGTGKCMPIMTKEESLKVLEGRGLTQSQIDLNIHVLTSPDLVMGGQGYAGVGKTTALDTLREILESRSQTVRGLAFTGKAADGIEQEAGIESNTIARELHLSGRTDWIVLDEASMVGSKDMHDILKLAREHNSRVLIIGDADQLPSIAAGRIFKDLKESGMSTVEMKEIVRQKDGTYKDVVQSIVSKRIDDAFNKLAKTGHIHEIKDQNERIGGIAKDYTDRQNWRNTIVLSGKNADARELNSAIRSILKERGEIGQQDNEITVRVPVSLSPTEQRFGQSYEPGQYIFARKAGVGGLRAGDEARIVAVDKVRHTLSIETKQGAERIIDLIQDGGNISAYEERQDKFSEREKIIFTKNDSKLKVRNGQIGEILKIDESGQLIIAMQDGSTRHIDPAKYQYVNHGDAVTTYKAQGMTQNNVIVNAPADGMQTYNAMYVQATRGKYDLQVYTDSTEKLIERVKIEQEKTTTLDRPIEQERDSQAQVIQISEPPKTASKDKKAKQDKDQDKPDSDSLELSKAPVRDREIEMEM
ncbi:MAG TPA: MobF family relaxase [Nitrospirota bacterium]|nr:MobF family relaxase [Nitrospirota bacterium]